MSSSTAAYAVRHAHSLGRPSYDNRALFAPGIRVQGVRPLCVPFSLGGAHEAARALTTLGPLEELAVESIWRYCVLAGEADEEGTYVDTAAEGLASDGQPQEIEWPYNETIGHGTEDPPSTLGQPPWSTARLVPLPLAHDGIEELVDDALEIGLAVVLVVELTDEFRDADAVGEIAVPGLTAPHDDFHAVLAVGAATNAAGTVRRLLIRNTWGALWGAGGFGWLPMEYLRAFGDEAAVIDVGSLIP